MRIDGLHCTRDSVRVGRMYGSGNTQDEVERRGEQASKVRVMDGRGSKHHGAFTVEGRNSSLQDGVERGGCG